ncbi:MAG: hypothetical protein EHM58_08240 [Ignavibacteriae bacterium]|nr:MAG: hypothetical protein EHM58_08240 [Ignavibacteriota bacterium]
MKKGLFILIPLLLMGYLIVITLIPRPKPQMVDAGNKILYNQNLESNNRDQESKNQNVSSDHIKQSLNCKSCHACEYPTKEDPCLIECPRQDLALVFNTTKEGPEVVVIDEMSENYSGVVFSHKLHTHMSEMSAGCTDCHHYNTTGPVLKCSKCHENTRSREDVSVPDLKAAYHRQCMKCHVQWSRENGCNTQCHSRKSPDSDVKLQQLIKEVTNKTHPLRPEPTKMRWETNYEKGKIVTFFHDEHVQLFKLKCADCHSNDNCTKCHESKTSKDFGKTIQIKKSEEEHHKSCSSCHNINSCQKCHKESEMMPFNHGRSTGWNLKAYHSKLACTKCHGNTVPIKKLDNNCTSCHKNFTLGQFDHKITGLVLSEGHAEAECNSCHVNNNFAKNPECSSCHDKDKSYPADLPGKRGK